MAKRIVVEQCLLAAERLNQAYQWGLSANELLQYAKQLTSIRPDLLHLSPERLNIVINNYHIDHVYVEALRNPSHPHHVERWSQWSIQVIRFLDQRLRSEAASDHVTINVEDLAQEALAAVWLALPNFRYDSRFHTCVFSIVSNCVAQARRAAYTQKRRELLAAQSLDVIGEEHHELAQQSLEDQVLGNALTLLSKRILAEHPDVRLQAIFHLWLFDEQPLREIGSHLNLSIPRVHALLTYALAILRGDERIQTWK